MAETIKIAVCDDEKNIRSYLVSLIKKQGGECSITEYASADAYLSDGKEHDIIFLDTEMGGSGAGMDGMGLARHIRGMEAQKQPIIIFVTGYEKYVYDAFDVGAFQYLVKPVDEQKFAEVFGRASRQILSGQIVSEAEQRKKKLEYYAKTGDLEEELAGQFYRIHRGYLINLFHVEGYNRTEVRMANGDKLLLSRYKYDGFVQAYMDYISKESL